MKFKLFCWCGALQEYAPPVVVFLLIVAFIIGTIGKMLGWSDPAAPTIVVIPPPTEEKKRRKTHAGSERRSSLEGLKKDDSASSAPTIIVRNEVVSPEKTKSKKTVKSDIELVEKPKIDDEEKDEPTEERKSSSSSSKLDRKSKSHTTDPSKADSYLSLASSIEGPKRKSSNSKQIPVEDAPKSSQIKKNSSRDRNKKSLASSSSNDDLASRNSVDNPEFIEDNERLSRPRPPGERGPTISYSASTNNPKGTPIPAAHDIDDKKEVVKNTSRAPKDLSRTSSPVRTRSPNTRRQTSSNSSSSSSSGLVDGGGEGRRSTDDDRNSGGGGRGRGGGGRGEGGGGRGEGGRGSGRMSKRPTSPPRTRSPAKRPTSPPRNRNSENNDENQEEVEKTRWGGVQTESSPAGPARTTSPMRTRSPPRPIGSGKISDDSTTL